MTAIWTGWSHRSGPLVTAAESSLQSVIYFMNTACRPQQEQGQYNYLLQAAHRDLPASGYCGRHTSHRKVRGICLMGGHPCLHWMQAAKDVGGRDERGHDTWGGDKRGHDT